VASSGRIRTRNPRTPGPRGGGIYVSELQRTRLLNAAFAVVSERGYEGMTVRNVSGRAGASSKTFYDLFSDREDCFLAAFDHAIDELAAVVLPAFAAESAWASRIRGGLAALLESLDEDLALSLLVFVEALAAGPRVLARRTQVSEALTLAVDEGRAGMKARRELPALTAEGVVGAVFSLIHARLQQRAGSLTELLNPLMAIVVLPYRGHAAAARELADPTGQGHRAVSRSRDAAPTDMSAKSGRRAPASRVSRRSRRTSGLCADFRPTRRTQMVLDAVAELPGANNRQIADAAEIVDQGQISKLLSRLEGLGLLHNTGGHIKGVPNAWALTPMGVQAQHSISAPTTEGPGGHGRDQINHAPPVGARSGRLHSVQ
jgi:AcrR family transcriptional regulator